MVYERVQKSAKHTSSQKKQSRIVPPPIDIQIQADSLPSTGLTGFGLPSKAERDAIRRSLFEKWAGAAHVQAKAEAPQPESESEVVASGEMSTSLKANQHQEASESLGTMGLPIQTKLTIGEPGDKYEQEADRVAAQVVSQINAPAPQQSGQSQPVQREAIPEEDDLQMKPLISTIQREEVPEEEEELQMKPALQLQASVGGMTATDELESSIQQAQSGGQPLDAGLQQSMEQAFGADFNGVKVHTNAQADKLNQSIQAKAFTTGQDVFFRQGEYNPGSRSGQELIAHELTHVVQQNGGAVQRAPRQLVSMSSVQRVAHGFDQENAIEATQWKKPPRNTVLAMVSMVLDDGTDIPLGTARNTTSVAHGPEHAEDVVIRTITANLGIFKPDGSRNKLTIGLTASPCTTTSRNGLPPTSNKQSPLVGCAEALISLVNNGITENNVQYRFSLEIICKGLYAPTVAGRTQAEVLAASQAAVDAMCNTGQIQVSGDVKPSAQARRFEVG